MPAVMVADATVDSSIPALEALVHELRQFQEDFAPRADDTDQSGQYHTPSPPTRDRSLLVQVQQQALQLAAAEYQLLTVRQESRDLRSALDRAEAEKAYLQKQIALNAAARSEVATLDVVQKEFTKLKQYLDFRLEHFVGQFTAHASEPSSPSAPAYPSPFSTAKSTPPKIRAKVKRRQPLTHAWEVDSPSSASHSLDHSKDCDCSVSCRQWAERVTAESAATDGEASHWNPYSYSAYMSPITAAILKGDHHGPDCPCIICMQWSTPSIQDRCRSAPGRPCSCYDCSLADILLDRADKEERPSHSAKSSIHSTHSTCYEPSESRTHSLAASKTFGNDSYSLMLNHMLNSTTGSPTATVKRASVRLRTNSGASARGGWTPPTAPSVCPPPSVR